MGFGKRVPAGSLPVFSVNTAQEAKTLIGMACPLSHVDKTYYSKELAKEQTLENLRKFSDNLERIWNLMQTKKSK